MSESVPDLARKCRGREFLSGFFEGWIEHEHRDIDLGQSDQALIERTLELLEDGQDLLVVNPFSYPLLPALVCASYMLATDHRVSTVDSTSEGEPLLLFPKEGYIGDLEGFTYRDTVSGGGLIDKTNVGSPGDFDGGHLVNRVTDERVLTSESSGWPIGLLFVDLRKDIWKGHIAEFEEFANRHQIRSVLFYTDGWDYAANAVTDMVDDELEVTRTTIAQATTDTLGTNPSRARREEYILTAGVDVTITTVDPGELEDRFDEMYEVRKQLEDALPDLHAVREVHNLLTELPVEPSVYDEQVRGNFYYNSTQGLIESLQQFREQASEVNAGLIDKYWRIAADIREELERDNPKHNVLAERLQEAVASNRQTVFVARNKMRRDAISQSVFLDDMELNDKVEIRSKNEVDPAPETKHVFVELPGYHHALYEFPPSTEIEYLVYPFFADVVRREVEASRADPADVATDAPEHPVTISTDGEIGRPERVDFDPREIENDISHSLSVEDAESGGGDGDSRTRTGAESGTDELRIHFGDGSSQAVAQGSMMTILESEAETVRRKRARNLVPGDSVVILGNAATDLYETITEQEHQKESIRQRELLIERWREILEEGLEDRFTTGTLLKEMQDRGSETQSEATVQSWADGGTLGPRDPKDVRLVLEIVRPGSEGAAEEIVEAMKYVRTLHRRIGRRVKRLVEAEIDPTREASFESGIGSRLDNIEDKIQVKNVTDTEAV